MFPAVVALVLCADPSALEQGAQAVKELRANEAIVLLEKARTEGPWSYAEHARLYEQLGIAYSYEGRSNEALAAFQTLLAIDPGHALAYTLSPKVTFLFEKARDQARTRAAPAIDVSWPRDGKIDAAVPVTVEVVADPAGWMKRVVLSYRVKGEPTFRLLDGELPPVGRYLSPLPPTGLAPLLRELLAEYAATGMPPAYLSSAEPPLVPTPSSPPEADPA